MITTFDQCDDDRKGERQNAILALMRLTDPADIEGQRKNHRRCDGKGEKSTIWQRLVAAHHIHMMHDRMVRVAELD